MLCVGGLGDHVVMFVDLLASVIYCHSCTTIPQLPPTD